MSDCYDHSIKKNMLSTVYGSKEDLKKDILKNYQDLQKWYEEQCELYKRPLGGDFDQWYEEYAGDTWEENNKDE